MGTNAILRAAIAAVASPDSVKTNAIAGGALAVTSLSQHIDAALKAAILIATLAYTAAKAVGAIVEAVRAVRATKPQAIEPSKPWPRRKRRRAKAAVAIVAAALAVGVSGCGVLNPRIEAFQKKVKAVPTLSEKGQEAQRKAAAFTADKARETLLAATAEGASTNVLAPAAATEATADALSGSLGFPWDIWPTNTPTAIVTESLGREAARLDRDLDDYRERTAPLVGKQIEGTGLIRTRQWTLFAMLALAALVLWVGVKIYGLVNPVVGVGAGAVGRVASTVLAKGFRQIVKGGEEFKAALNKRIEDPPTRDLVLDLFQRHQTSAQSEGVQNLVRRLT